MFRVWNHITFTWIENVSADEALIYKEEGYVVQRMDLPYTMPAKS